jgi:hypothetical protein
MYWVAGAGLVATAAALEIEDDTASRRKSKVGFGRR